MMEHEDMDAEALRHAALLFDMPVNEETTPLLRKTSAYGFRMLSLAVNDMAANIKAGLERFAAAAARSLAKRTP